MSEESSKDTVSKTGERENHFQAISTQRTPTHSSQFQSPPGGVSSPSLSARNKLKRNKSKPHLKRATSATGSQYYKKVYSVDDDVNDEIEEELDINELSGVRKKADRDYIEGYTDALKSLHQRKGRASIAAALKGNTFEDREDPTGTKKLMMAVTADHADGSDGGLLPIRSEVNLGDSYLDDNDEMEGSIIDDMLGDDNEHGEDDLDDDDDENTDSVSLKSTSSIDTLESLNLKDRQDAINSTHPFGIKIWKPSLYKKKRSVAARAEDDIHDYELHKRSFSIGWGVNICNFIWSMTFGITLYLICLFGCGLVFLFSGFALHRQLRPYVKILHSIGTYFLYPFGKFVLLNRDKNYMDEDELDGRSLGEFQRWREQEEGRLFFAPPRRYTAATGPKPGLKDHKGRPLSEIYNLSAQSTNDVGATASADSEPSVGEAAAQYNDADEINSPDSVAVDDDDELEEEEVTDIKKRFFGRGSWSSGRFMFFLFFYIVLQPILFFLSICCWFFVFTIPMGKITNVICDHLRRHPLALHFEKEKEYYKSQASAGFQKKRKHQLIIMCTYRVCGLHYYKYTIDGTNIFFINLLSTVIFVILDSYVLKGKLGFDTWYTQPTFIFCTCLFSVIPLAYFIGQAVASISAQSSMGVGAVINAFFSTIVEIFLYCVALNQANGKLVEGSLIGSILAGVLLLPGLSMCGGALKRKTQRYNPRSAGVSSTMLLFAMVMMFAPSMFYQTYGTYEIRCTKCSLGNSLSPIFSQQSMIVSGGIPEDCTKCRFVQPTLKLDNLYHRVIKPFSLIVAIALFLAYVCGLYFTLRTHASLIWATNSHEVIVSTVPKKDDGPHYTARSPSLVSFDHQQKSKAIKSPVAVSLIHLPTSSSLDATKQRLPSSKAQQQQPKVTIPATNSPLTHDVVIKQHKKVTVEEEEEESGGHDAPNWSRRKSSIILLSATLAYAIIAEILVDEVDEVLSDYPINPKFLGLTVFALVPNTTEFLNAISFAVSGNVALSMEIGSAYALQVVLIQIPALVIYCMYQNFQDVEKLFPLVFPRWDIIATLLSIFLFTYIYAEGKSNYFKGVILILTYAVVLVGFWFNDMIEDMENLATLPFSALGGL